MDAPHNDHELAARIAVAAAGVPAPSALDDGAKSVFCAASKSVAFAQFAALRNTDNSSAS